MRRLKNGKWMKLVESGSGRWKMMERKRRIMENGWLVASASISFRFKNGGKLVESGGRTT
jgi:hypothetical protein